MERQILWGIDGSKGYRTYPLPLSFDSYPTQIGYGGYPTQSGNGGYPTQYGNDKIHQSMKLMIMVLIVRNLFLSMILNKEFFQLVLKLE